MPSQIIRKEIDIEAPIEHVWQFLGTQDGLIQWWGTKITLESRPGGQCEEIGEFAGRPYHLIGEVTVYEPPRRLELTMRDATVRYDWPAYTTISLTLSEQAGDTRVSLIHRRFDRPAASPLVGFPGEVTRSMVGSAAALPFGPRQISPAVIYRPPSTPLPISTELEAERWLDRLKLLKAQANLPSLSSSTAAL